MGELPGQSDPRHDALVRALGATQEAARWVETCTTALIEAGRQVHVDEADRVWGQINALRRAIAREADRG